MTLNLFVCVCTCTCHGVAVRGQSWKLVLSFHVGPRDPVQVVSLRTGAITGLSFKAASGVVAARKSVHVGLQARL